MKLSQADVNEWTEALKARELMGVDESIVEHTKDKIKKSRLSVMKRKNWIEFINGRLTK